MSWYEDYMWIDTSIKFMYTFGTFPLIGLPVYIILAMIIAGQYTYMDIWSLVVVLDESKDPDDWNLSNWFWFPVRRSIVFTIFAILGTIGNLLIPINFVIVPVIGLLAWINNFY